MFPRKMRLGSGDIGKNQPKKLVTPHFFVRFGKNKLGHNRFATVVGAAFEKTSVKRHYWKRKMREALKKWPNLGIDAVVSPLAQIKKIGAGAAAEELERLATNILNQK